MLGTRQTVVLDGQEVPPASMLTKGVAVAVDLSLTVGLASLLFYLISTQVPLDTPGARTPVGLGVAAALERFSTTLQYSVLWVVACSITLAQSESCGSPVGLLSREVNVPGPITQDSWLE